MDGDEIRDVTEVIEHLPAVRYPLPRTDPLITHLPRLRPLMEARAADAPRRRLDEVRLLSPVANPGKIVAAPVNYLKHLEEARADAGVHHNTKIEEIRKIGLFLKATSSVVGPSEGVAIRLPERRNDHEVEVAAIIGTEADRVPVERALDYVAGYCIGLDMTARGSEERSLRKSVDSFTVLGPWMVTADTCPPPVDWDLSLMIGGETRQSANTRDLVLSVAELIAFASAFYTLHPGDVILTGTPDGVGPVQPGDTIAATVQHVGTMTVAVRAAALPPGASF
ncbi:fumarylacetoacetate hydrolase family protein [Roseomonas chloroacetimidivorans]|uniref:fumarylacetoacetate hydrolase family protein n=1 Tax=Roseomonas chloroacetimidivorans TaxID=1766656 RepID=UPI003C733CE4